MAERVPKWISVLFIYMMLSSSFLLVEPSPYDCFMLLLIGSGLVLQLFHFPQSVFFSLIVILTMMILQFISVLFTKELYASLFYLAITLYLMVSWIVLVGIGQKFKMPLMQIIMNGYLISAVISAWIGILAYFHLLPNSESLLMYGRAKAFFKDPNVFGPFLIMPSLYVLSLLEKKQLSTIKKIIMALTFFILVMAIFISFSRAAWGNWVLSLAIYFVLTKRQVIKSKLKMLIGLSIVCIPLIIFLGQSPFVRDLLDQRLNMQGYDESRFDTQKKALVTGLHHPFGIGPGQSEFTFQMAPHSLYARILTENGILSVLLFIFFLFISIHKAYQSYGHSSDDSSAYFLVICACLVGLLFNSFFIDTLHWRHLWLLLALAWFGYTPLIKGEDP